MNNVKPLAHVHLLFAGIVLAFVERPMLVIGNDWKKMLAEAIIKVFIFQASRLIESKIARRPFSQQEFGP